ncbi:hypothetical protein DER46DRAFT_376602 [Fusarium sp. MPI-SDFR-AT-0072]|nr:hypothetical protein DER46DRAFT_376602 [Fusarium sp. MPI-SDFR-AT-0072]
MKSLGIVPLKSTGKHPSPTSNFLQLCDIGVLLFFFCADTIVTQSQQTDQPLCQHQPYRDLYDLYNSDRPFISLFASCTPGTLRTCLTRELLRCTAPANARRQVRANSPRSHAFFAPCIVSFHLISVFLFVCLSVFVLSCGPFRAYLVRSVPGSSCLSMRRDPALKHQDTFPLGVCVALHYQFDPANSSFFVSSSLCCAGNSYYTLQPFQSCLYQSRLLASRLVPGSTRTPAFKYPHLRAVVP